MLALGLKDSLITGRELSAILTVFREKRPSRTKKIIDLAPLLKHES